MHAHAQENPEINTLTSLRIARVKEDVLIETSIIFETSRGSHRGATREVVRFHQEHLGRAIQREEGSHELK